MEGGRGGTGGLVGDSTRELVAAGAWWVKWVQGEGSSPPLLLLAEARGSLRRTCV